ncbi:MAG: galactose oxidase-like domain-containing protein, partial [Vicinamibacteraceae bacterium]
APTPVPCDLSFKEHGRWEKPWYTSGVVGVHAALMRGHKVVFFTYEVPPGCVSHPALYGESSVLDLPTGYLSTPTYPSGATDTFPGVPGKMENLFCAGHAFLPDGRLFVAGGEREDNAWFRPFEHAVRSIHVFQANGAGGGQWHRVGACARGRWYPSCVTLPDGKVLIVGGWVRPTDKPHVVNDTFEIFDPSTNQISPERPLPYGAPPSYPWLFVLPGNTVLVHAGRRSYVLDLQTLTFSSTVYHAVHRPDLQDRTDPFQGSAVLLPLSPESDPPYAATILAIGGAGPDPVQADTPATRTCEKLDMSADSPAWEPTGSMNHPRTMPDAVLLPDGTVLVVSGSSQGMEGTAASPVYPAELFDPVTEQWKEMCHMTVARLYHATAILLPDGRVLVAGTDCAWNPPPFNTSQLEIEIFNPPYIYADRPEIGYPASHAAYGSEVEIPTPDAATIERVAFMRCGAATHSFNSDQRCVLAKILSRTSTTVRVAVPGDAAVAPPGVYLVFVVDEAGVPSVGRYTTIGVATTPAVSLGDQPVEVHKAKVPKEDLAVEVAKLIKPANDGLELGWGGLTLREGAADPAQRLEELEREVERMRPFIRAFERKNPLPPSHAEHG